MHASGILAAVLSTALGGTIIVSTRYLAASADPVTIGVLRWAGGLAVLLPVVLARRETWPKRPDWAGAFGLALLFFVLFPLLFNAALGYTTAARGALALSTAPVLTMLIGALLRIEPLTGRKSLGVLVAMAGVALALGGGTALAPEGAWRGDLLMIGAALCLAFYNVWSGPFIARSGPTAFAMVGMAVGLICLGALAAAGNGLAPLRGFTANDWLATAYLGFSGGAGIFLWVFALGRISPTLVAVAVTINPVTAAVVGALLLAEPVGASLVLGLVTVAAGIAIASRRP